MGSGAISKLPDQLDKETIEKLVPPQFFDEQRFHECATSDGLLPRSVLAQRGAAIEAMSEAAKIQQARKAGGEDVTVSPGEDVLACLQRAAQADPSYFLAAQSYAGALASAGKTDEAVDALLVYVARPGACPEARITAQQILLNDGIGKMNVGDSSGALERFSRAEEMGKIPPQVYEPIAAAKYMEIRAALQRNPRDTTVLARLSNLRSELEEILATSFDSARLVDLLARVESAEALASGLGAMAGEDWTAAAPFLEAAADGGELSARYLAAQAYLKAAISQFEAFTAARKQFSTEGPGQGQGASASDGEFAMLAPPALTRSLSDNGVSALAACQAAALSALNMTAMTRTDVKDSEHASQIDERLSYLDQVANELLSQVAIIHKMDETFQGMKSGEPAISSKSRLLLTPSSMSCGFDESADAAEVEYGEPGQSEHIVPKGESECRAPKKDISPVFDTMTILNIFRKCDTDMDGAISRVELAQIIAKLSTEPWDDTELELIFSFLGRDGSETISSGTFLGWLLGYERPEDANVRRALQACLEIFASADWDAIELPVPKPKEKEKTELDMKIEATMESLKATKETLHDAIQSTERAAQTMQEAHASLAVTGAALGERMDRAKALVETATLQMAAQLGDEQARAELQKAFVAVPPPPKPKASWKRPDATARREAARANREKDLPYWYRPCDCFQPISIPEVGEWLAEHKETGQTFRSWERLSMRLMPHGHVRVIELLVVGPWPDNAPSLDSLARYCQAFFSGCQVRICHNRLAVADFASHARQGLEGQLQICIGDIFDTLLHRRPERDVLCTVAVTMADIYPIKDGVAWNFVFGQARMMDGVGVFSFSRFYPSGRFPLAWTGQDVSKGSYDADTTSIEQLDDTQRSDMLKDSCKVLTHEIGHILGIRHCIYYQCLMCGTNNLIEGRKKPMHLCPVDLRKLQHACGFDVEARYRALAALCEEFGWTEDAAWIVNRLAPRGVERGPSQ